MPIHSKYYIPIHRWNQIQKHMPIHRWNQIQKHIPIYIAYTYVESNTKTYAYT